MCFRARFAPIRRRSQKAAARVLPALCFNAWSALRPRLIDQVIYRPLYSVYMTRSMTSTKITAGFQLVGRVAWITNRPDPIGFSYLLCWWALVSARPSSTRAVWPPTWRRPRGVSNSGKSRGKQRGKRRGNAFTPSGRDKLLIAREYLLELPPDPIGFPPILTAASAATCRRPRATERSTDRRREGPRVRRRERETSLGRSAAEWSAAPRSSCARDCRRS